MYYRARKSIFIYPDFSTAIYGMFRNNGILISGQEHSIKNADYSNHAMVVKLQTLRESTRMMFSDIATDTSLSSYPLQRDPYESKLVDIKQSTIPKAGEGVVLKKDVLSGVVVAYLNGVKFDKKNAFSWNPFKKKSVFLLDFEDDDGNEVFLDIPERFTKSSKYNATSGHKVDYIIICSV